ncbi:MAG: GH92 family glycosyl hydrolase [Cyclobacteriaceae bacterium]|nr:GH92 family glycosyl hydrolase [Cyclobacteriaceae bacterium]
MKLYLTLIALLLLGYSCQKNESSNEKTPSSSPKLIQYVNPFIGTKRMGHTFPGATAPFGMVQLSPETNQQPMFKDGKYNPLVYSYCAGYQYEDSTIFGFSHTHFSGTGHSDLGDFLIMPTVGKLQLEPGDPAIPHSGYHSQFSHSTEHAEPGYYEVELDDYGIKAEMTSTERVGFHQYTMPQSDSAHIILDLRSNIYDYEDKNVWTFVRVENDSTVTGYRQTNGWARTRIEFFAMQFSKPFTSYGHKKYDRVMYNGFYRKFNETENFPEMAGKNICAYFNFSTTDREKLKIKFALSPVSTNGALNNLQTEIPEWDFDNVKEKTQEKWNNELSKIIVETETEAQKTTFYTALYHTMLSPILYEDADGRYRGLDHNIYTSTGFTNYTIFSLWDTYRALHPLFNLIEPQRNNSMVKSMLAHYKQSVHHMLPVWSHYANENWCMVGYHSVSVIADAVAKGTTDVDLNRALKACVSTANVDYYDGITSYKELGFVAEDQSSNSVSKTLEYAYDDWCIAQIAKKAGNLEVYNEFMKRSESYKNVYDPDIGYMRPKLSNGQWRATYDPMDTEGQGFIEGNALNYGLYVPQDIEQMVEMMGGKDAFSAHLDKIFTTEIEDKYIEKNEDITRDGIIGNYVHGNEPGHHIPYLYNWTNDPWKTQERVRMIVKTMYSDTEDGLCGNDDAGQMSAWYIFSALGFYPVTPGSNEYAIGSPSVVKAVLQLGDGKTLTINTVNQGGENVYVDKVEVNGKPLEGYALMYYEIKNGGSITYHMSSNAKK